MPAAGELILLTHEFAPFRGGAATYVQEIAAAAVAEGFPVTVWTVDYRGRGLEAQEKGTLPFPVERLPSDGRLSPVGLAGLMWGLWTRRKRLEAPGSRVVLLSVGAMMAWMPLWSLGILPARGVTCFFHGSELLRFARPGWWGATARRFFAHAAGFLVASRYVGTLAGESGLLPPGAEIGLAPCACPAGFAMHPERLAPPDDGALRILTVARLHPRKGQAELAEILARLPADLRGRVVYQLAGTGEAGYRARIEAACRAGGLRHEFLGGVSDEDLAPLYQACTLYAQTSRTLPRSVEGFGISFLEAAFFGKPVVAYRSGGIGEAVIDGETGTLVPEGDAPALLAAIEALLNDPGLRGRLGAGGRRHAASFDWRRSARTFCEWALR